MLKISKYLIGGVLLCLVIYSETIMAEDNQANKTTSDSNKETCSFFECLFSDGEWFKDVTPAISASTSYSKTTGSGYAGQAPNGIPTVIPFETDKTSALWNVGIGWYKQNLYTTNKGLIVTFNINAGYGRSYSLDREGMTGRQETSFKKYFALNAYIPLTILN